MIRLRSRRLIGTMVFLAPLMGAGCGQGQVGDGLPREPISGTVSWKGKPLPRGTIQYVPIGQAEIAPIVAVVEDGRYQIARDQGPIPGKYTVVINEATDAAPPADPIPGESPAPPKQAIPPKYNAKSTLTADIKAGEDHRLDYDLKP